MNIAIQQKISQLLLETEDIQKTFFEEYDSIMPLLLPYDYLVDAVVDAVDENIKSVVDIGCGTGEVLYRICQRNPNVKYVVGIDNENLMIKKAKEKFKYTQVTSKFIKADFTKISFPVADVCISSLAIHHLKPEEQKRFISNVLQSFPTFIHLDVMKEDTLAMEREKFSYIDNYMTEQGIPPQLRQAAISEMKSKDTPLTLNEHMDCCKKAKVSFEILQKLLGFVVYKAAQLK